MDDRRPPVTAPGSRRGRARPPLVAAAELIGDRWSLLTIDALIGGPQRFGELSERVDGIAPNVLTRRLRRLEADGIISSAAYSQRPVRLAYELTDAGQDLASALAMLAGWGSRHDGGDHDRDHTALHQRCGSELEVRLWCPTCSEVVGERQTTHDLHL